MDLNRYKKDFKKTAQQVRLPNVIYGNLLAFAIACLQEVKAAHDDFIAFAAQNNDLLSYNSQMQSLTALLNKKFDPSAKRIRLENVQQKPLKYKLSVHQNALFHKFSLSSAQKGYLFKHQDFKDASGDVYDGIIWVPDSAWPHATEVRNVAEFYIFSGKKFIIKNQGTGTVLPEVILNFN